MFANVNAVNFNWSISSGMMSIMNVVEHTGLICHTQALRIG